MNNLFIIENGLNTSYIDSVIMALFYKMTHLQELLSKIPEKNKFSYLQDLINNVIDQVRRNCSIDSSFINEIRNYSFICGWKEGMSLVELYNVMDYIDFLLKGFDFGGINFEIVELTKNSQNEESKIIKNNYIELSLNSDGDLTEILDKWITVNLIEKNKNSFSCYHFKEIPLLLPIYINRMSDNKFLDYSIDIKKRIKFNKNNDKTQQEMSWVIHSIICFSVSGVNSAGKYYSIIRMENNNWLLFSNDKIPSLSNINIFDKDFSQKIKQECVVVLYRLDDILF